ncbi:ribonuclease H [Syntrophotalea carbinolica DSM 2380]|uniref:Ribonuclease H n=1 Tax=Syntrophotalea carbinolica (strain DSM 2380 / NBRC 103641 / GraBd1) TaxID=338963 RepID=Q3A0K8_SYNC1|nr:ribonuclease HI [Syntrophotalea carbinolica]ABA90099.1 ribonuclease H [Syntrophotalea carbinolica DSM 2380]
MNPSPQLYLLDGSSYIYRAFYGIRDVATADGMPTNAVFGFTRMLLNLLQEHSPDYLAVVFDRPREETFRREIYSEYKAHRDAMPDELAPQIPYIRQILQALNIPALEAPGFEADDVIATLGRRHAADGLQVTVVTGDKDLMQIVGDRIELLDTMKDTRSGAQQVFERFGVPPELVADVLGLAGDTSDNIPGVPGVGEKTASELVQRFGSLEGVLKWTSLVNGKKRRSNLETYAEQARLSKTLATLRDDVPLEISLADLQRRKPNLAELIPLLRELEFEALEIAFTPPPPNVVEIYSDGSGRDSGPGGYGVILRYGEHEKELSGFEPAATSQRMELLAAIRGLEALNKPQKVRVFSDSQYLVRGMSQWMHGWIRDDRLETPGALANQDLWQQLLALSKQHEVSWEWVRGHAGHPFNERCDKLAKQAVEEGLQKTAEVSQPEAMATEELPRPVQPKPAKRAAAPTREDTEFDVEEDGQLRLC